jgi:hypothetical protein
VKKKGEIFSLITNIDYLRGKIKPDFIPLNKKPKLRPPFIKIDTKSLRNLRNYFDFVCKEYGCTVEFSRLQKDSFFYYDTDIISLGFNGAFKEKVKNILSTFYHELSHCLQKNIIYKNNNNKCLKFTVDQEIEIERTAERLSYFFCKEYHKTAKWDHRRFSAYRSKREKAWIRKYYEKFV